MYEREQRHNSSFFLVGVHVRARGHACEREREHMTHGFLTMLTQVSQSNPRFAIPARLTDLLLVND